MEGYDQTTGETAQDGACVHAHGREGVTGHRLPIVVCELTAVDRVGWSESTPFCV